VRRAAYLGLVVALLGASAGAASATCPLPTGPIAGLAATVRLLEPAMPRLLITARLELPADHPDYGDLLYLRERRVIARGAQVDPMAPEVWQSALDVVAGWYGASAPRAGDPGDPAAVARDLAELVERVGRAVRPVALIAWAPEDRQRLAFLAMVWNWSSYPRLIVYRLDPDDARVDARLAGMARRLDTCAFAVRDYVAASAPVARDLFLAENRARMFIVGSEPDLPGAWPVEVPRGEEIAVFAFEHPLVASLDAYAAVFVGDPAPVLTFARLLPFVRTNLSPIGLTRVLVTPR